jgi:acylphosphatase
MIRRTVYYSGRVQGVGFRYTTCRTAEGFRVTGYVRNLRDGRVEVVVEGEAAEVDRFLAAVAGQLSTHIQSVQGHDGPTTGEFGRFDVRY